MSQVAYQHASSYWRGPGHHLLPAYEKKTTQLLAGAKRSLGTNLAGHGRVRTPLFGPLPTLGVWTAVGLTRGQFFTILGFSVACFALVGGPVWEHPRGAHFVRITVSYGVILPAVALALFRERPFPTGRVFAASALIALAKLVVTALLLAGLVLRG